MPSCRRVRARYRSFAIPLALLLCTVGSTECRVATDSGSGALFIQIRGTVHHDDYRDRDCWWVEADDGRRYELRRDRAPAELFRDGKVVTVRARPRDDLAAGCGCDAVIDVER